MKYASLVIHRHPNAEISGECGNTECKWHTIKQDNNEDGWRQITTWYSVHLIKWHGATNEQAFNIDHGTYNFHGDKTMKLPLSLNGKTTVNELIAALLEFPPNAQVNMTASYMEFGELEVEKSPGVWITVLES